MISPRRLSRFQPGDVGQSPSLPMCNASHWRQGDLYRIFRVWPPSRRNATQAPSVGIRGRTSPAVFERTIRRNQMLALGRNVGPALMLVALSATARAQQKACDIDEGTPNQVARAVLDLQLAQGASKPEDGAAKLKDAVKLLNDGDLKKNPTGRSFVLGKTLVMWLSQPGMTSGMTTRGAIGLTTEPTAPFDIIAGIDSAFTVVESSNPDCASQTAAWRQQKGWV